MPEQVARILQESTVSVKKSWLRRITDSGAEAERKSYRFKRAIVALVRRKHSGSQYRSVAVNGGEE